MPPYLVWCGAPGRTRTCGPLLSFQHQAFPDRPSNRGCWLDYILDVTVPTRIVSEDPSGTKLRFYPSRFPADYPILVDFYSDLFDRSTRGSQGVPAYRVVHSMGSRPLPH